MTVSLYFTGNLKKSEADQSKVLDKPKQGGYKHLFIIQPYTIDFIRYIRIAPKALV